MPGKAADIAVTQALFSPGAEVFEDAGLVKVHAAQPIPGAHPKLIGSRFEKTLDPVTRQSIGHLTSIIGDVIRFLLEPVQTEVLGADPKIAPAIFEKSGDRVVRQVIPIDLVRAVGTMKLKATA